MMRNTRRTFWRSARSTGIKLLYAGCVEVVLNGSKPETGELLQEASKRFGPEKMLVSLSTMDFLFKTREFLKENVHELVILNPDMLPGLENETDIPYIAQVDTYDYIRVCELLQSSQIRGISGAFINDPDTDIMQIKGARASRWTISRRPSPGAT